MFEIRSLCTMIICDSIIELWQVIWKSAERVERTFLRRFNFQWKVTLNFSTLSREVVVPLSPSPPPEYRFEMTKAPLLSEEAQISPMIEEKRGTRDIISTRYSRETRGWRKRKGEARGGGGRRGVRDRSIPIGMHARRFLRVDTAKWQKPEKNRPMILRQEFQGKLIRSAFGNRF